MAKTKTSFFCQNCGTQYAKWLGQCNSCHEWNTIVEEVLQKEEKRNWKQTSAINKTNKALKINEIPLEKDDRISTQNNELNRVLGGGLVKGSMTLLGGEPGIGKSTLLLQIALAIPKKVLYVSGEESQSQIKMRAERLQSKNTNCLILTETNTQNIFRAIEEVNPEVVVIDSIQTLHSDYIESTPGSISQIRETTAELIKFAKESNVPVILIVHITKDGARGETEINRDSKLSTKDTESTSLTIPTSPNYVNTEITNKKKIKNLSIFDIKPDISNNIISAPFRFAALTALLQISAGS